jgi:hypothetical protein
MSPDVLAVDDDALVTLVDRLRAAPPRTGRTRVIGVDGRSGSGKTTVALRVARLLAAPVVQLEYLYPGWDGLRDGVDLTVSEVLVPLRDARVARVPSWDWYAMAWAEPDELVPPQALVVEGVGACAAPIRPFLSLSVWVDLPDTARLERAKAREWTTYEQHWDAWARQEDQLLRDDPIPATVDVVLANHRTLVSPGEAR